MTEINPNKVARQARVELNEAIIERLEYLAGCTTPTQRATLQGVILMLKGWQKNNFYPFREVRNG